MISKTSCQHCGQHIEFDVEHADNFTACPSCNRQTRLLLAKPAKIPKPEPEPETPLVACKDCGHIISRRALACPNCGCPGTVTLQFAWRATSNVMVAFVLWSAMFGLIALAWNWATN